MYIRKDQKYYHTMLLPGVILLLIFSIAPMFGVIIAFQKFSPVKGIFGSKFVGLYYFKLIFSYPAVGSVIRNTLTIATCKIVLDSIASIVFAILLNEIQNVLYKRFCQVVVYMPHFISWVILALMFGNILSYNGMLNQIIKALGGERIMFMASNTWARPMLIITNMWRTFGYGSIIYLAAITGFDPNMYEAASIDGAGRWKKMLYITLPSLKPTIILMATLNIGNVLNAGFEQVFNMYNPAIYDTCDIIDTYVYRNGMLNLQYSFGTAVGLGKSVVSFVLLVASYRLAKKFAGYSLF